MSGKKHMHHLSFYQVILSINIPFTGTGTKTFFHEGSFFCTRVKRIHLKKKKKLNNKPKKQEKTLPIESKD